ncbi:MAG: hypothetical protein ACOCRZ_04255 [Halothermotrichaceae bacterium]
MDRSDYRKLKKFIFRLNRSGFTVQEGKLGYIDMLKLCSEGKVDSCLGNHAGAPYAAYILPPAPEQSSCQGRNSSGSYKNNRHSRYPANIDYITPGFTYKLRPDEAIVMIGRTPPPAIYFSYRSYLGFAQNNIGKDYSDVFTTGDEYTGIYHRIFASLGDSLNNFNIWTEGTPDGVYGNSFNSFTIIITTADRHINKQVREVLSSAGFEQSIMNDDIIPPDLVNMGLERGKDTFLFIMRAIMWDNRDIGMEYLKNLENYVRVFRITPDTPQSIQNPWPVPYLKNRETGITEFEELPTARDDLDHLRGEIINRYGSDEYDHIDLTLNNWFDGYEGIFLDKDLLADNRDATYIKTEPFQLTSDDDFVIIYGVNHKRTAKAIFHNASFYGYDLKNGVAVAQISTEFQDSALEFFPMGYNNARYYYLSKFARKATDEKTIIIPYSTGNPYGKAYGVDNYEDVLIGFRLYLDQEAMVGPALFDIIWDNAILFTKKKSYVSKEMR